MAHTAPPQIPVGRQHVHALRRPRDTRPHHNPISRHHPRSRRGFRRHWNCYILTAKQRRAGGLRRLHGTSRLNFWHLAPDDHACAMCLENIVLRGDNPNLRNPNNLSRANGAAPSVRHQNNMMADGIIKWGFRDTSLCAGLVVDKRATLRAITHVTLRRQGSRKCSTTWCAMPSSIEAWRRRGDSMKEVATYPFLNNPVYFYPISGLKASACVDAEP